MTAALTSPGHRPVADIATVLARWFLGGVFIYLGLNKALHPVEFLKLVRQYDVIEHHFLLNLIASALPWFEVFCGLFLILGLAVRGAAVMLVSLLVAFTVLILRRALAMQETSGLPLCAIKFDCGCGAGEVLICRKLIENGLLAIFATGLAFWRSGRFSLRHSIFSAESPSNGRVSRDDSSNH